jgi:hypothetical protein
VLRQLLLGLAKAPAVAGEQDGAAAGGSLVDGENRTFGGHAGSLELLLFRCTPARPGGRKCREKATVRPLAEDVGAGRQDQCVLICVKDAIGRFA